jgi:hypothetical protein
MAVRDLVIHPRDHDLVVATHGRGIWIIDDISPLRALTKEALAKDIIFLNDKPVAQKISAYGGWVNGDATFVGPNEPNDAVITYYQKKRHIFGDMSIEVVGPDGQSLGTIPSSKRRGLNRVNWSMRVKAPQVPPAASIAYGATSGPRVVPGTYTVKMLKDRSVYETKLDVVRDPRVTHTDADRKAQFDLAMKLHAKLAEMTTAVERINSVRLGLDARASKLPATDALTKKLRSASSQADELRRRIVATKEGGMITGEERLREHLSGLYGDVASYEGRPSQTQLERADALSRELVDVVRDFDAWAKNELPSINAALAKKKMEPVEPTVRSARNDEGGLAPESPTRGRFKRVRY